MPTDKVSTLGYRSDNNAYSFCNAASSDVAVIMSTLADGIAINPRKFKLGKALICSARENTSAPLTPDLFAS
jgi:hypothetical protein